MSDVPDPDKPGTRILGLVSVYRIVKTDPPQESDFWSDYAKGKHLRRGTREERYPVLQCGISTFDEAEIAATVAKRFPFIGQFVAAIRLDLRRGDDVILCLSPGETNHYDLGGPPAKLLTFVTSVAPVAALF